MGEKKYTTATQSENKQIKWKKEKDMERENIHYSIECWTEIYVGLQQKHDAKYYVSIQIKQFQ